MWSEHVSIRGLSVMVALAALASVGLPHTGGIANASIATRGPAEDDVTRTRWRWPLPPSHRVVRGFEAPDTAFGAGHRGVDLAAPVGSAVRAPADGTVAFAGPVVDRDVVTIRHIDGLVSTLEPVTPVVAPGDRVSMGEIVGRLGLGGHAEPGTLHLGARMFGRYVDPMRLLDAPEPAILLPCC